MNAFLPHDLVCFAAILAVLTGTLLAGRAITFLSALALARAASWGLVFCGTLGINELSAGEPAGLRMLALIAVLLWSMKAVVSIEAQAAGQPALSAGRWLCFAVLWVGMRPALFAGARKRPRTGTAALFGRGLVCVAGGAGLIALGWFCGAHPPAALSEIGVRALATVLLLPGLSLVLHFGLFNWMAATWRLAGFDCRPLFRAPLRSQSLTEFWGRRWNLAFSEMATLAVYRPLAGRLGKNTATMAVFLFSGLAHEVAISVPVRAGYGLPLLYFSLHAGLVLMERSWLPIERWGWLGRCWTFGWLVLPLPILFHPYFLRGVVWPLIGI